MANKWSDEQSTQITALYGQLKGEYQKKADQKLFGGPQLDYIDAFNTLTSLINQQKKEQPSGLEKEITGSGPFGLPQLTKPQAAFGLATIVLALAAVYTLGAAPLVAATYALPLY